LAKELNEQKSQHIHTFSRIEYYPTFPDKYPPTNIETLNPTPANRPVKPDNRRVGIIAEKIGMMSLFDEFGIQRPITVLRVDCCQVIQIKHQRNPKYGTYNLTLGISQQKLHRLNWKQLGYYAKVNLPPKKN